MGSVNPFPVCFYLQNMNWVGEYGPFPFVFIYKACIFFQVLLQIMFISNNIYNLIGTNT